MSYIDQIRICEEKVARKQVLKELLPELKKKKTELEYTVRKREEVKRAEQKDVDRLEAGGPMNLIYSLLGQRENRLEKEQREAYEDASRYEASVWELAQVTGEWEKCQAEWEALVHCEQEYEEALAGRVQELIAGGGVRGEEIRRLSEDVARLKRQRDAWEEISAVGERAWKASRKMEEALKEAEGELVAGRSYNGSRYVMSHLETQVVPEFQKQFARFEELLRKEEWVLAGQLAELAARWSDESCLDYSAGRIGSIKTVRRAWDDILVTQDAIRAVMEEIERRWEPVQERHRKLDAQLRERIVQSCQEW